MQTGNKTTSNTQDDLSVQPWKTKVPHKLVGSAMNSFIRVVDSIGDTFKTDLPVNFCFTVFDDIIFVIGLMADQLLLRSCFRALGFDSPEKDQVLKE